MEKGYLTKSKKKLTYFLNKIFSRIELYNDLEAYIKCNYTNKNYVKYVINFLQNYKNAGVWMISTDAGKEVCKATIDEVYKEMKKLRENLVEEEELKLVKNYMLGALLGDVDGPFQIISRWKTYILHGLTEDYFYNTIKVVRSVSAEQLNSLANAYLKEEDFYELVVY